MKGRALAIAMVIASGVAAFVLSLATLHSFIFGQGQGSLLVVTQGGKLNACGTRSRLGFKRRADPSVSGFGTRDFPRCIREKRDSQNRRTPGPAL